MPPTTTGRIDGRAQNQTVPHAVVLRGHRKVAMQVSPLLFTVLRAPSADATCTCRHWQYCDHACHHRDCDPTANACDITFLPDDGGLTAWGCRDCTPGEGAAHVLGCELIGWNVPARMDVSA